MNMPSQNKYSHIIIGAGHNALICANYLARKGKKVLVLERRQQSGGAAATEEVFPGYKISRYSYVFSIFRKKIIDELFPKNWRQELILYPTEPSLFIPTKKTGRYLLISNELLKTRQNIAEFSDREEADNYAKFYQLLQDTIRLIEPLWDEAPASSLTSALKTLPKIRLPKNNSIGDIVQFLNSSSAGILNQWLKNDCLKAALSYAGTVGQMQSPYSIGSAFLQLHHVANTIALDGQNNTQKALKPRYYPRGGMGSVSEYLANLAIQQGAVIQTQAPVKKILTENQQVKGVEMADGTILEAPYVISNVSHDLTFNQMLDNPGKLPPEFQRGLKSIDYSTNCSKLNLVLKDIPDFKCLADRIDPEDDYQTRKQQACEIMHNTLIVGENMQQLHHNYLLAEQGKLPSKPTIQMLMPSLLDDSLTPANSSDLVVLLFVQYTPYDIKGGWNQKNREKLIQLTFKHIEEYAPNFSQLVKYVDAVFPPDIEAELGLTGGNIFQGSMDLSNLYASRPMPKYNQYQSPIRGLFSCSSANHPGGGVCGAAGRNAAMAILKST